MKRDKEPFKGEWCLPGGFVLESETSRDAAKRVLQKETNLKDIYVEELGVYDEINRDPRERTVSVAYSALTPKSKIHDNISPNAKWFDIEISESEKDINLRLFNEEEINIKLSKKLINKESNQYSYQVIKSKGIAFDHALIINDGIIDIRKKANNTDIIFNLMPKEFTIGELKQVYEIIQGKVLINSAFRRAIASKVEPVKETIKTGGHRPSQMFKYRRN